MLNRANYYDDSVSGRVHHQRCLLFENGYTKQFKPRHHPIDGQKLVIIGSIDGYQLCLNISSSENQNTLKKLLQNKQIMRLSRWQVEEIYRKPIQNTYVRLDWVFLFKDVTGGFNVVSFVDSLIEKFDRVAHLMKLNPMNMGKEDISTLPQSLRKDICEESKLALQQMHGMVFDD